MKKKTVLRLLITSYILAVIVILYLELNALSVDGSECAVIESTMFSEPRVKGPGERYIYPWNEVHVYEMSQTESRHELIVLDVEKNEIKISLVARFSPIREELASLHEKLGIDYKFSFVDPYLISASQQASSKYSAEEMYSTKRHEFETSLTDDIINELSKNHIALKSLLILSVELPEELEQRIIKKYQLEQEASNAL